MKDWKLLNTGTVEEETQKMNIDLDEECEELDILIFSCGTSTNDNIANSNGVIKFMESENNYVNFWIGSLMMKNNVKRVCRIKFEENPYSNFSYNICNYTDMNHVSNTTYMAHCNGYDRNFNDKIKRIELFLQSGYFGVGSGYAVYGR